jgi:hypothetical protein
MTSIRIILASVAFGIAGTATAQTPLPMKASGITVPPQNGIMQGSGISKPEPTTEQKLAEMGDAFLALSLEAGTYDPEYVDAYYGPESKKAQAAANPRSKEQLAIAASEMIAQIDSEILPRLLSGPDLSRAGMMKGQLQAAVTKLQMIGGKKFSFNEEAQGLFSTTPALKPLSEFDPILARLEKLIPGKGPLAARVDTFNDRYSIPAAKLKPVFDAAIAECRKRTAAHIVLPEGESFTLEFVKNKPWSGYNYYKGNYKSLIQVNTDLPIRISRAVDLGCHEGYPGHHVLNLMIESKLVNQNRWTEYQVNPLYSPQSVVSEGSANYGIDLAFPGKEKLAFERDVLYPLAGLNPKKAKAYYDMQAATEALGGARLTIAKMYLDGEISRAKAVELSQRYMLLSPARAEQSVGFTDHYRSYVINYGWGKDLVRGYIEHGGVDQKTRWRRMEQILSEPTMPADLLAP